MEDAGTAPGLFKCSCTEQKEKEQADRQGGKLGADGKRLVLKKKAESIASVPTLTPPRSQHLPPDHLHPPLLKGNYAPPPDPQLLASLCRLWLQWHLLPTSLLNLSPGRISLTVPHDHVSVGKASGHSQAGSWR